MADRSRRAFLRDAASLGAVFGSGCLGAIPGAARVPVLAAGGETVQSQTVPRGWYLHVETVRKARRVLESALSGEDGVAGIKIVRADRRIDGMPGLELAVEVFEPLSEIPSAVEGISVRIEESLDRGLSACYNRGDFDPVPGGVVVEPSAGFHFGTACCRAFVDGERRLLTAAHLWDACESTPANAPLYQSNRRFGEIDSYHRGYDVAVVEPDSDGAEIGDTIKLEGDRRVPVAGRLTEWGIAVFLSEGRSIVNMGASSGRTRGQLSAAYVEEGWNRCVDFDGHGIEAKYRNAEGDSGGPVFHVHDGAAYIVATQQMWLDKLGTDCGDNIVGDRGRGTASYHLADGLGMEFAR